MIGAMLARLFMLSIFIYHHVVLSCGAATLIHSARKETATVILHTNVEWVTQVRFEFRLRSFSIVNKRERTIPRIAVSKIERNKIESNMQKWDLHPG
jgi:hypothetical protein